MSQREEFVLAVCGGLPMREACRRWGVTPPTGYRWLRRYMEEGQAGLVNRSTRPHQSPRRTPPDVEARVRELRAAHPAWGGRKLAARLRALGELEVPSPSTITAILRRHALLDPRRAGRKRDFQRFERPAPNELWQMDFKGHVPCGDGRCHPLTVLDDHSRYALELGACANERTETVRERLTAVFRRHGLPWAMLMDNGSPWGNTPAHPVTPLSVWLMRLQVTVLHSRPRHPQTAGKDERFHLSLVREVLDARPLHDLVEAQHRFDVWRRVYNHERPHEALGLAVPASRYAPSQRSFPERLPDIEYGADDAVRRVQEGGWVSFRGRALRLPKALRGHPIAFRPTTTDGTWHVYFCTTRIAAFDLTTAVDLGRKV